MKPQDGDHASNNFKWDLFVIAGNRQCIMI